MDVPQAVREDPRRIDVRMVSVGDGATVTVVSGDRVGLMADVAGALDVQHASVRSARAWGQDDMAVSVWDVDESRLDEAMLRERFDAIAAGLLDPATRLRPSRGHAPDPAVQVRHDASSEATVVEVRVDDRPGHGEELAVVDLVDPGVDGRLRRGSRKRARLGVSGEIFDESHWFRPCWSRRSGWRY